jgi:hypothetical protein
MPPLGRRLTLPSPLVDYITTGVTPPRRRSPLQLAAFTAAVLIGFELVLTHWFYLYLPWFFPFVALALIGPLPGESQQAA